MLAAMFIVGAIAAFALVWLLLDLWRERRRDGLVALESQHSVETAAAWLRIASGYRLVLADDERGLFVWERGRRFYDGGFFYYGQIWRDQRTGRARFVIGVIGHTFHRAEELARARSRFVAGQVFHLTPRSARNAVMRAADPRTARKVLPPMRRLIGRQTNRPPAIDAPMSPTALRFTLRAPLAAVTDAIADLPEAGWRLVETASLHRGLVTQHRYCFEDAAERTDAGAEYLLEVRGYANDWVHIALDWFPLPGAPRPPRRPAELQADISQGVAHIRSTLELAE
jgi:hypothetical protein